MDAPLTPTTPQFKPVLNLLTSPLATTLWLPPVVPPYWDTHQCIAILNEHNTHGYKSQTPISEF